MISNPARFSGYVSFAFDKHLRAHFTFALLVASALTCAEAPRPDDYEQGITLEVQPDRPLIEMVIPDAVYQSVTRDDLGDVRVFNRDGTAVPHALCDAPPLDPPTLMTVTLPVFALHQAASTSGNGETINLRTATGTALTLEQGAATQTTPASIQAHIIDARASEGSLQSIQFDWDSPDGASETSVRIETSRDLDRWEALVGASTLLRTGSEAQGLRRERIPLPPRHYDYLRVERADGGPPLTIHGVTAERIVPAPLHEPSWFSAVRQDSQEKDRLLFDTTRLAPVNSARLHLPPGNSALRVQLESRRDAKSAWTPRWSGEMYAIVADGSQQQSAAAEFAKTTDRYWRLHAIGAATLGGALEFAYRPARIRFLAQGPGPFTLAFGSRRMVEPPPSGCDRLLADLGTQRIDHLLGTAFAGPATMLGGAPALQAVVPGISPRRVALWLTLIAGVALLIGMALSLLRRIRNMDQTGS